MEISYAVMTVPERRPTLAELLGSFKKTMPLVSFDEKKRGPWWNARRCWLSHRGGATHQVVLHDDALIVSDFEEQVEQIVNKWPDSPISFFVSSKGVGDISHVKAGTAVAVVGKAWGVGLCLPIRLAEEFVEWCDTYVKESWIADDTRLALWIAATQRHLICPIPNLVQHNPDVSSTVSDRDNLDTVAPYFGGLSGNWIGGITHTVLKDRRSFIASRKMHMK